MLRLPQYHTPISQIPMFSLGPQLFRSHVSLPRALEEEPDNENLQSCHTHHHQALNYTKVENPPLCTPNGAEVTILSRAEIFLIASDG